jgi:hypothetical protein
MLAQDWPDMGILLRLLACSMLASSRRHCDGTRHDGRGLCAPGGLSSLPELATSTTVH